MVRDRQNAFPVTSISWKRSRSLQRTHLLEASQSAKDQLWHPAAPIGPTRCPVPWSPDCDPGGKTKPPASRLVANRRFRSSLRQNLMDTFGGFSQIENKTFITWTKVGDADNEPHVDRRADSGCALVARLHRQHRCHL